MADQEWTAKELIEALKKFPPEAKVYYEIGAQRPRHNWQSAIRQGVG